MSVPAVLLFQIIFGFQEETSGIVSDRERGWCDNPSQKWVHCIWHGFSHRFVYFSFLHWLGFFKNFSMNQIYRLKFDLPVIPCIYRWCGHRLAPTSGCQSHDCQQSRQIKEALVQTKWCVSVRLHWCQVCTNRCS